MTSKTLRTTKTLDNFNYADYVKYALGPAEKHWRNSGFREDSNLGSLHKN